MTRFVWYRPETDEIFLSSTVDALFCALSGTQEFWEHFELIGEL
jgi:hypothetical protein